MPRALAQLTSRLREPTPFAASEPDRDLLARFLHERDEAAFEELVSRHSRLVCSAVAKVLPDGHDAEDALQATFLVLVCRAKSVDWRSGLGPWLYGVAHSVVVKARDAGRTRTRKEKAAGAKPAVTVTLEKLGAVSGRVLDAAGAPAAGAEVRAWLQLGRAKYDNLPGEVFTTLGVYGIAPGAWQRFTGRTTKTAKDSTFMLPGLLSGQEYFLVAGFDAEKSGGELLHRRTMTAKSGQTTDLGDIVVREPQP